MMLKVELDFVGRDILYGSPSASWWVQMATAVVFGLSFATFLTLLVTPCALALPASLKQSWAAWRHRDIAAGIRGWPLWRRQPE